MRVCTVVARNYLDRAHALACSLRAQHPDARLTVLLLDGAATAPDPLVEYVSPGAVGIPDEDFEQMAVMYDVTELATAVKPWLLRHLLGEDEVVTYLDPDGEVLAPVDALPEAARAGGIALVQHVTTPIPRDGLFPQEELYLACGTYNLGVIAVSRAASEFLDWWQARLRWHCLDEPKSALFVDQKWLDLGARFFPSTTVSDPGVNVAYWNLHERRVEQAGGDWLVNGQPLRYMHYSGYSPEEPDRLTRYQQGELRTSLAKEPALRALFNAYGDHLARHEGPDRDVPYAYQQVGGVEMTRPLRRHYRAALLRGAAPQRPLADGGATLAEWLAKPERPSWKARLRAAVSPSGE